MSDLMRLLQILAGIDGNDNKKATEFEFLSVVFTPSPLCFYCK